MKKFQFKLQPLLNYRDYLERVAKQRTAAARRDVVLCEKQIADLKNLYESNVSEIEKELQQGISAESFQNYWNYLNSVNFAIEQEKQRKIKLARILKEKLQELKKKRIDKKAMELYRERLKTQYIQEIFAVEQKALDDISSLKTARKVIDEATSG